MELSRTQIDIIDLMKRLFDTTARWALPFAFLCAFWATAYVADFFLDAPFIYTTATEWSANLIESSARFPSAPEAALHLLAAPTLIPAIVLLLTILARQKSDPLESAFRKLGTTADRAALGFSLLATVATALVAVLVMRGTALLDDERAYEFQAQLFARGSLMLPEAPAAFRNPMMLTTPAWMSKYPIGHSLILTMGAAFGAARVIPPILAGLITFFTYRFAKEAFSEKQALLVAALLASSPFLWFCCATLMAFSSFTCSYVAALWLFAKYRKSGSLKPLALSGALLSLAAVTRPFDAAALAFPLGGWLLLDLFRFGRSRMVPIALFGCGMVPLVGLQLAVNHHVTGSPLVFLYSLAKDFSLGFTRTLPGFPYEHTPLQAIAHWSVAATRLDLWLLGWPGAMVLVFVGLLLGMKSSWDRLLAACLGVFAIAYTLIASTGTWDVGPTYYFAISPLLIIIAVRGLHGIRNRLAPIGALARAFGWLPIVGALVGFVTVLPIRLIRLDALVEQIEAPWQHIASSDIGNAIVVLPGIRELRPAGYSLGYPYTVDTASGVAHLIRPSSFEELTLARRQLGESLPVYGLRLDVASFHETGMRRYRLESLQ